MSAARRILEVGKQILLAAVDLGIEEAGTRICGPTAWKVIKKLLEPVFAEIKRRYPSVFEDRAAAEKAAQDLESGQVFESMVAENLAGIEEGQSQILRVLARNDETLRGISDLIDRSAVEAERKSAARHDELMAEFAKLELKLGAPRELARARHGQLSSRELADRANGYQADTMKWISAGDANAAAERLATARDLADEGLAREPDNVLLLATKGYVEKTDAQVASMRGDVGGSVDAYARAAQLFTRALQIDPEDVSSLNGMANCYLATRDYDHAIQLGMMVVEKQPMYGAALWDLGLALDGKLNDDDAPEESERTALEQALASVYGLLEQVMPLEPQTFPATYLAHVQKKHSALRAKLEAAAP
jgi:tetratricopeptide (TPR) repeat protein